MNGLLQVQQRASLSISKGCSLFMWLFSPASLLKVLSQYLHFLTDPIRSINAWAIFYLMRKCVFFLKIPVLVIFSLLPTSLDAALVTLLGYACDVICNVIITSKDVALYE